MDAPPLPHDPAKLLIAVSQRLERCLRPDDIVARLGGDEFTLLLEDISGVGDAEKITRELRAPFTIEGHRIFVTASIGIVLSDAVQGEAMVALEETCPSNWGNFRRVKKSRGCWRATCPLPKKPWRRIGVGCG